MIYKPGETYFKEFTVSSPSTGEACNADSTPVATACKNGTDDSGFSLTVTNMATGRYKVVGTVPTSYTNDSILSVSIALTVEGISTKAIVDTFKVYTIIAGTVQTDASNTAISFKIDRTESDDDYWKGSFIRMESGSIIGQIKRILGFNATTKFITVDTPFSQVPSAGTSYIILNG